MKPDDLPHDEIGQGWNAVARAKYAGEFEEHVEFLRAGRHNLLVLAALDEREAAWEAFAEVDFGGLDFWSSFWPTIALRYMFADVWDTVRDDPGYAGLVQRMDQSWGV